MTILVALLNLISFAFGAPIFKDNVNTKPIIEVCSNGGCYEEVVR